MLQEIAVPPVPPAPPGITVVRTGALASPTQVYEAYMAQRDELHGQLERLTDERSSLSEKLTDPMVQGPNKAGLEARITAIDARIAQLDKQISAADAQLATAAAVPTAVAGHEASQRALNHRDGPPEEVFVVGTIFMVIVFLPLSIAFARRIWRRGAQVVSAIPGELMDRMGRLEQAVESIAIEVERVGEGQRFMTRVMTDTNARGLGAGPAEPIRQPVREAVPARSSETPR
jgi:hypothetical protein